MGKKKKSSKKGKIDQTKETSEEVPEMKISLDTALKSVKEKSKESEVKEKIKKSKKSEKDFSLDSALLSSKETQTDLQGLLQGVSEGKGYYRRDSKKEEILEPKLIHETKKEMVQEYIMEDIPISERDLPKDRTPRQNLIKTTEDEIKPIEPTKDDIYIKLQEFFKDFINGYNERYYRWEDSISNILAILRKMRKFTKKNTEDLVSSIKNMYDKIQTSLEQFKIKRDEIEKVAGVNIETMSGEFKKVLGLLELQIKEYQLKKVTDELMREQKLYM